MTLLEIILITIIWIGYAMFTFYQSNDNSFYGDDDDIEDIVGTLILLLLFCPLFMILRILLGLFSNKIFK